MECKFIIKRKEILSALLYFKRVVKSANKNDTIIEVTIINGGLTLNIPGGVQTMQAETKGGAKFTINLGYLVEIIKSYDTEFLTCLLTEDTLKISNTFFNVYTTFFKDDSILRSIDLPLNYTKVDLLRLKESGKYTKQEIAFNNLTEKIEKAILEMKMDTDKIHAILRKYGFTKKEVKELILTKLNPISSAKE